MSLCDPWADAILQFQNTLIPDPDQAPSHVEKQKVLPNSDIVVKKLNMPRLRLVYILYWLATVLLWLSDSKTNNSLNFRLLPHCSQQPLGMTGILMIYSHLCSSRNQIFSEGSPTELNQKIRTFAMGFSTKHSFFSSTQFSAKPNQSINLKKWLPLDQVSSGSSGL